MKTRLFSMGRSLMDVMRSSVVMFGAAASGTRSLSNGARIELRRDELGELDHAVREAPLVVVPAEDLREVVAHDLA